MATHAVAGIIRNMLGVQEGSPSPVTDALLTGASRLTAIPGTLAAGAASTIGGAAAGAAADRAAPLIERVENLIPNIRNQLETLIEESIDSLETAGGALAAETIASARAAAHEVIATGTGSIHQILAEATARAHTILNEGRDVARETIAETIALVSHTLDTKLAMILHAAHTQIPDIAKKAGIAAVSGATNALKNQGYMELCKFLIQTETNIKASYEGKLPAQFKEFFTSVNLLKTALENPASDQNTIDRLFQTIANQASETPLCIEGYCIDSKQSKPLKTTDFAERLEAKKPEPATTIAALNQNLSDELKKSVVGIRRKIEINLILGNSAPKRLHEAVGVNQQEFDRIFKSSIKQVIAQSNWPAFLRFIPETWLLCYKFIISIFMVPIMNKVNKFLARKLQEFATQDRAKIMDFITNILCDGLYLYVSEITNIADEVSTSKEAINGTIEQMFEQKLSTKSSLHEIKGQSKPSHKSLFQIFKNKPEIQNKFYNHILDQLLKQCFSWSISRHFVKLFINLPDLINNSLPQTIRTSNGYAHNFDQAIIRFATPLLQQMKNPQSKADDKTSSLKEDRDFSNLNKTKLKKTIQSIFLASELTQAPNIAELKKIYKRHVSGAPSLLESIGVDTNSIVYQTAEVAAHSILESIADIMNEDFVKTSALDIIKSINARLAQSEEHKVSADTYETTQKKRIEVLNQITQHVISNAVHNAPILNSSLAIKKVNEELKSILDLANSILKEAKTLFKTVNVLKPKSSKLCQQTRLTMTPEALTELIKTNLSHLSSIIKEKRAKIDRLSGVSEDQKQMLFDALDLINHHVHQILDGCEAKNPDQIKKATAAFALEIQTSSVFKAKGNISIMDNPSLKKIATFALSCMMKPKFNKAYDLLCDFKAIRYGAIHPLMTRHIA